MMVSHIDLPTLPFLFWQPRNIDTNGTELLQHPDVSGMASYQGVEGIFHAIAASHQYGNPHQDHTPVCQGNDTYRASKQKETLEIVDINSKHCMFNSAICLFFHNLEPYDSVGFLIWAIIP